MQTRLVVALAVSGAVHAAALVFGSGSLDMYRGGGDEPPRTSTPDVMVSLRSASSGNAGTSPAEAPAPVSQEIPEPAARTPASETPPEPSHSEAAGNPREPEPEEGPGADTAKAITKAAKAEIRPAEHPEPEQDASETAEAGEAASRVSSVAEPDSSSAATNPTLSGRDDAARTFLTEFMAELSRHKYYPRSARVRQQQGKVVVKLSLQRDGAIEEIELEQPSRYPALNRAAVRSVRRMNRFKPFPESLNRDVWRLSVPFRYSIEDS